MGEPHESGEDTFLSSKEMDRRPLGSSEQFSGIISSEPDFSIKLAGGARRSISSDDSEVDATARAFNEPKIKNYVISFLVYALKKINFLVFAKVI